MLGVLHRRRSSAVHHVWDVPGVRKQSTVAVGRRDTITTPEGSRQLDGEFSSKMCHIIARSRLKYIVIQPKFVVNVKFDHQHT